MIAQLLVAFANSHHDAKVTSVELVSMAQQAEKQCQVEQEKSKKDQKP
jgi:hypothetical protein